MLTVAMDATNSPRGKDGNTGLVGQKHRGWHRGPAEWFLWTRNKRLTYFAFNRLIVLIVEKLSDELINLAIVSMFPYLPHLWMNPATYISRNWSTQKMFYSMIKLLREKIKINCCEIFRQFDVLNKHNNTIKPSIRSKMTFNTVFERFTH